MLLFSQILIYYSQDMNIICRIYNLNSPPTIEFCKTAATAITLSTESTMSRTFHRVVAALFLYGKKGCCHHFYLFSTPKSP